MTPEKRIARASAKVESRRLPNMTHSPLWISIDPGTTYYGYAVWRNGALDRCGYSAVTDSIFRVPAVVIERPVIYPRSAVDPNDIVRLAYSAGIIARGHGSQIESVEPRQWKGTSDGAVFIERIKRAIERRLPSERCIVSDAIALLRPGLREHVYDAIGLGLVVQGVKI